MNNRSLFSLFLTCISIALFAQAELSLIGLNSVLQSDLYNPARFRKSGLHLGLPTASYNFYHSGVGFRDFVDLKSKTPTIKLRNLEKGLADENYLTSDFRLQTLKIKYVQPKWSLGFEHEIYFHSNIRYPGDLIHLYLDGNQQFIGQSIMIAPRGLIYAYNSYGLSFSYTLSKIAIGIRPKLLAGSHFGNTPKAKANLETSSDIYQLSLDFDYQFDNVGLLSFAESNLLNYKVESLNQWRPFSNNLGVALDLGVDVEIFKNFNLAFSVIDIGSIKWKQDVNSYVSNRTIVYNGIDIDNVFNIEQVSIMGALDSVSNLFDLIETSGPIVYQLPPKWFGLAQYSFPDRFDLSLISHFNKTLPTPLSFALMFSGQLTSWCKLGSTVGNRFGQFNLGFHAIVSQKQWQAFLMLGNVSEGLDPTSSTNYQVRLGLNFHLASTLPD